MSFALFFNLDRFYNRISYSFKCQSHKLIKNNLQAICRQITEQSFECAHPFCRGRRVRVKVLLKWGFLVTASSKFDF